MEIFFSCDPPAVSTVRQGPHFSHALQHVQSLCLLRIKVCARRGVLSRFDLLQLWFDRIDRHGRLSVARVRFRIAGPDRFMVDDGFLRCLSTLVFSLRPQFVDRV